MSTEPRLVSLYKARAGSACVVHRGSARADASLDQGRARAPRTSHTAPPIAYVPAEQFEKHVSEREGLTVPGGQGEQ